MNRPLCVLLLVLAASAVVAQPKDAQRAKDVLTGDARASASANPQSALFKPAELERYVGKSLKPGRNAGGGAGCQWVATDDEGDVIVTVVPARYHEPRTLAKGFKPLPAIGSKGFVVPELGGWVAGTIVGDESVLVSVDGPKASEQQVVALLQEAIKRRGC
jgi:hypothetical protein